MKAMILSSGVMGSFGFGGVDRILLGVLDAVVRILGFELSLESSKRILQIAHQ